MNETINPLPHLSGFRGQEFGCINPVTTSNYHDTWQASKHKGTSWIEPESKDQKKEIKINKTLKRFKNMEHNWKHLDTNFKTIVPEGQRTPQQQA